MQPASPDAATEAAAPLAGGAMAAVVAALTVVPLATVVGRLTQQWAPPTGAVFRIADASAYGAVVGVAVGAALAAAELHRGTRREWRLDPLTALVGPAAGGAMTSAMSSSLALALEARGESMFSALSNLVGSVAFGVAVGAAIRLRDRPAIAAGAVGGAIGGFASWLLANALVSVTPTTFASWRALAVDPTPGTGFLRSAAGAALPAVCVPLGIAAVDSLRALWQR